MNSISIVLGPDRPDLICEDTLATLFRKTASKNIHKTALIFGGESLSYGQLDRWSDVVAGKLAANGIGPGDFVGLWYERGLALHVAVLGIVKSGAAYVPMDREMPEERLQQVLMEVGATACLSDGQPQLQCQVLTVGTMPTECQILNVPVGPTPDDNAYILYTSGSTGRPKGIQINHRQICHLVRAEQSILNIRAEDKVYQGFSVSFDMWCEESWIGLYAGATLWVADATTAKAIDELNEVLIREEITVLHAVPSLLAIMDDHIPLLRVINAGGEACPAQVVRRWSKPGNSFYNSYGPTETTVTATMTALEPDETVHIGSPLPNYNLAVIDEKFNPVPIGVVGELAVSGPGVSLGYINRPELTIKSFICKPAALSSMPGDRIYRTGDAVMILPDGRIAFHGRIDDQVKLRGYRIEMGEIEAKLSGLPGVVAAAATLQKDHNDQQQLVGYVVVEDRDVFTQFTDPRAILAKTLPSYMVPVAIEVLDEMPRLPSGKVNRKALPAPAIFKPLENARPVNINPKDPFDKRILSALQQVFGSADIDPQQDFFTDLGGHSLLAATFVSLLRKKANIQHASLRDIYTHRPLKNVIAFWEREADRNGKEDEAPTPVFQKIPSYRYWFCGAAQALALLFIYGLFSIQIFVPYLGYYYMVAKTTSGTGNFAMAVVTALLLFCLLPPLFSLLSIAAKWLILPKTKEGDYPLWGLYYFRYWFVKTIQDLVPIQFMNGTPLYALYLRMLGMKVSSDAQISSITVGVADLVTIGSDTSLSSQVVLNNAVVENGFLRLRKIVIGDHAYIGSSAIISGGAIIEPWGELQDLSHLPSGQVIKEMEVWKGSPATKIGIRTLDELPQPLLISSAKRNGYTLLYGALLLIFPFVVLLPLLPVIMILNRLDLAAPDYNFSYFKYIPVLTLFYLIVYGLETILFSRLLQRKIQPGSYSVYSWFYIKKWFSDQLISLSLIVLHPIYATVYVSSFFRMLGAKVGKNTEISTASSVTHFLLDIGDGSFVADAVTLGEADVRAQKLILDKTSIGHKSFVGNSALIPQGYHLPDNMLIGVLSTPPTKEQLENEPAPDWFGSPAMALPHRQSSGSYPDSLTITPSIGRRIFRATVEGIRIILPESVVICCSVLFIAYAHDLIKDRTLRQALSQLPWLPLYYLVFMGIPALLFTVLLKWCTVGKYKKEQKPMWTHKVWRSEAITSTYEALAVPFLLEYMKGTPFLPFLLRLFGLKAGKRVWLNTTDITEHDLVTLGDDTALNVECGPQTHLFEDRVMKTGKVQIGARCSIGARSIILYDSEIGNDVNIEALSLVMKGENLQNGTSWTGSPVSPINKHVKEGPH